MPAARGGVGPEPAEEGESKKKEGRLLLQGVVLVLVLLLEVILLVLLVLGVVLVLVELVLLVVLVVRWQGHGEEEQCQAEAAASVHSTYEATQGARGFLVPCPPRAGPISCACLPRHRSCCGCGGGVWSGCE